MAVVIDHGPITADLKLAEVPREKWPFLMRERRDFMHSRLGYDCRCLVEFVDDAKVMFSPLGFVSVEDMIKDGYGLEPEEIGVAVEWLRLNPPNDPVPLQEAILRSKAGRPPKDEANADSVRIKRNEHGNSRKVALARLDRDGHTELAAQVRAGTKSANAAAIQAGIRKKPQHTCPECGHKWRK